MAHRYTDENGVVGHAELELGGEIVMLATPNRDYQSPRRHRQECETADRWLDNPWVVDGVLVIGRRSRRAPRPSSLRGSDGDSSVEDGPVGRLYTAEDLEGHRWMFQQR